MAKVYSWEVNKSPKKYAYIVHPTDFTKVYVGNELKGSNLENIKNWTSSCTDTEYEQHFKMMTELCASKGYNVEFESVTAYMNVNSTCDNLRGPAGRGIDHIALLSKDSVTNISKYIIYYDDNTTDTFEIQNGKDGRDGIDGSPGAKGDSGVSSKLVMIYASGVDEYGNLFTPERPNGGSYDFTLNKIEYPVGWEPNDSKVIPPVWMSSRTFASTEASTDKQWSLPVQITGETGAPGVDGVTTEFIYYLDDIEPSVENLLSPNESGYVPPVETGWTPSPTGVDEDHLTEWSSIRKFDRTKKEWGRWEKPFIWSKYGVNGQDGDGVQYIYLKNNGTILDNPTPKDYLTNKDYQSKDGEWVPMDGVGFINIDDKLVSFNALEETTDGSAPAGVWTDNPSDLTSEYHSQWVSSRKYRKHDNGKMSWGPFSAPALWAKFGQDGKNATSIRKLYCLSTSTSNPPDLPKDSTTTGDWGTGFPIDYQVGVNVVWGIEAEIWAHNSNFVETYKMVSERDKYGNVIPPTDAMNNFRDVDAIPNEQVVGVKYLRFNEDYYEWLGGWSKPFLVTGLKGETGYVPNYTTYVYAYGHTEYPPTAPISKSAEHPGTSSDTLGTEIVWLDFPDTSDGRIDGAINPVTGKEMRWYQCVGHVYGHNNEVYEWGAVTPCNGHDGTNGAKGNYMEVRFGVTADGNKPDFYPYNPVTGEVYREPVLLDENGYEMGWYATDESLPDVPSGGAMWQIWALIDGETNTVVESNGKHWNGPKRISGEKGEQGVQGPAGMRGVTGIPGATSIQLYCLGTYGNNENSESYWETGGINGGDGYFGSDNWKNDAFVNDMSGWYKSKEMPYSDILTAYDEAELEHISSQPINKGRVVRLIESETETVGPTDSESMFTNTTHTYYLIDNTNSYEQLTQPLAPSEEFNVYVWAIQGTEKWEAGLTSKYVDVTKYDTDGNVIVPDDAEGQSVILNGVPSEKQELYKYVICENKYYEWKEIDGDKVEHTLTGIEWGSPFKLQGTNGLRGLSGSRGQVVYPMGVYNQEEVYITTEDKAPYVYDSNDGMYYVYNDTTRPWVGVLPGYDPDTKVQGNLYKTILIHPDDAESSFLAIDYDPTSDMQVEEVPGYKYLYYSGKYYIWNGSNYALASRYKYSIDGSGMEGTWMSSQHGDSPANNYANATNSFNQPAWVRFESFKALYTSIGIIENGMIGSAVYNNEFMFSQQGIDPDGNPTTYAIISGQNTDYGFLSGYEYDEKGEYNSEGNPTGNHWRYKDSISAYIPEKKVDPYEVKNDTNAQYFQNIPTNKPIHAFRPNVCINFATGQMWLSGGKFRFGVTSDDINVKTSEEVKSDIAKVQAEFKAADAEIMGSVKTLSGDIDSKFKEITNKFVANDELAGLFSTLVTENGLVTQAEISTSIQEGIATATIKADKVNIGGDVNINDILTVDNNMVSMSNATIEDCHIEDCTITNVTIEGSLRSPFILDDNNGTVDSTLHDNIVCHMVNPNATGLNQAVAYPYALQWDKSQNGRKVTIANGLWEHATNGTEESVGIIRINAPTTENIKVNFENTTWGSIQDTITNLPEGLKSGEYKAYTIRRNPDSDASFNFWLNQTAYIKIPPGVKTYTFYARRLLATTANNPSPKQAVNNSYTGTVIDRPVINTGEILPIQPVPGTDCDTLTITLPNGKTKTAAQSEYWTKIEVTVLDQKVGCTVTVTHARSAATTYNTSTAQIIVPDLINTGCFFEDGIQKDHIILSREIVELTGFGSPDKFYGWVVTNRTLLNPKLNYGCQVKALLSGTVRYVYDSGSKKYVARPSLSSPYARYNSDGAIIGSGFQEYSDGKYAIIMSDTQIVDWKKIFDASTTMIMVTGIGPILNSDRNGYGKNPAKACVAQRTAKYKKDSSATSGYTYNDSGNTDWPGFEIWISDDTTTNPAGFNFIIFSTLESFGILDK